MKNTLLLAALLASGASLAADPKQVCSLSVTTGSAASTASPTSGTCSWPRGAAVVLMWCSVDVVYEANWSLSTGAVTVASATQGVHVSFSSGQDLVPIYLNSNDKDISVIAATASGTCYFYLTQRRRPF